MSARAFERIPAELRELPRWVCWKREERPDANGEMKPTKVPRRADGRGNAKTKDGKGKPGSARATWSDYGAAVAGAERCDGIGFVFSDDDDLVGIDLDHCRDPESGAIDPAAQKIVDAFKTYTEASVSGTGVHLILRGRLPEGARNRLRRDDLEVEVYEQGRYFCMTGQALNGGAVRDCQAQLEQLSAWMTPPKAEPLPNPSREPRRLTDQQVLNKARASAHGAAFDALMRGDTSAKDGDHSRADMALLERLAFWTNCDEEQMDRLFRTSGLYREKWEREDYRAASIAGACAFVREHGGGYSGAGREVLQREKRETKADPGGPSRVVAGGQGSAAETEDAPAAPEPSGKAFCVLQRQHVTLSRPEWIMPGRIVRGALAVIGGRQGDGKGKMVRDLLARASRGGPWPTDPGRRFCPLTVIDFNAEDSPEQVIFPEYEAAGADLERVFVVHRREDGKFPNLSDSAQLEQMARLIRDKGADLVTIDPVGHFLPGVKFIETESVLEKLGPLMQLAESTGAAIVPVLHFNKGQTNDALAKFLGSVQWTAIARSALGVVPDPDCKDEDRERRQLWTVKSNLAPKRERKPWGFEITSGADGVVRVEWDTQPASSSEADAFRLEGARGHSGDTKEDRARTWLCDYLQPGRTYPARLLYEQAEQAGHKQWAVKKALHGSSQFNFMSLPRGYRKGVQDEWYLAGTLDQHHEEEGGAEA